MVRAISSIDGIETDFCHEAGKLIMQHLEGRMRFRWMKAGALVIVTVTGAGACNKSGDSPSTNFSASSPTTAEDAAAPVSGASISTGTMGTGELRDANIFYLLDGGNTGDSAKAALAVNKGTSAEVREFAKAMVRDHHTMRQMGLDLAKRLSIQPAEPAGDSLSLKTESMLSKLQSAAKGRDFDKAYMDHEVGVHREMLSVALSASSATRNSEIKYLIQKSAPILQKHLDQAQAIQKNLLR